MSTKNKKKLSKEQRKKKLKGLSEEQKKRLFLMKKIIIYLISQNKNKSRQQNIDKRIVKIMGSYPFLKEKLDFINKINEGLRNEDKVKINNDLKNKIIEDYLKDFPFFEGDKRVAKFIDNSFDEEKEIKKIKQLILKDSVSNTRQERKSVIDNSFDEEKANKKIEEINPEGLLHLPFKPTGVLLENNDFNNDFDKLLARLKKLTKKSKISKKYKKSKISKKYKKSKRSKKKNYNKKRYKKSKRIK